MELPDPERLLDELAQQMRPLTTPDTALVGIHTGGVWIAERLHRALSLSVPMGSLDVSFYRDDFKQIGLHPQIKPTDIPFDVEGRDIILVDDVLYTGRTIRAAMNELFDYGRPASIRLAALIDRGGRELPITAQFLGTTLELPPGHIIELIRDGQGIMGLKLNRVHDE